MVIMVIEVITVIMVTMVVMVIIVFIVIMHDESITRMVILSSHAHRPPDLMYELITSNIFHPK